MDTETKNIIQSQLLENTGKHFLDSGGDDGRAWQRNQKNGISFDEGISIDEYGVSIPIASFMASQLLHNGLCTEIETFFKKVHPDLALCYSDQGEIEDFLIEYFGAEFDGHLCSKEWFYTYNWDNDLSQDLQGVTFEINGDTYCILQSHNGADARGGHSNGRVYKMPEPDYFFLGMQVQFNNPNEPDGNPFETFYEMESEGGKYNEETKCFELDGKECAPYCVGLQY